MAEEPSHFHVGFAFDVHAETARIDCGATAVKDEMVRLGIGADGIVTVGKSFDDPLVPTGKGVREPQNRRAVIELGAGSGN